MTGSMPRTPGSPRTPRNPETPGTPGAPKNRATTLMNSKTLRRRLRVAAPVLLSVSLGLALGGIIAALLQVSPLDFYGQLWSGTVGSSFGWGQVLYRATPLIFCGLSVAFAFQARLFNIGAEGQMAVGGLAMAAVGAVAPSAGPIALILALGAGALAGGIWGGIPGVLKARTGSHEVIVTILLNFIAFAVVNYLLVRGLALPETVRTAEIVESAHLFRLSDFVPAFRGAPVNAALFLALLCAVALAAWLRFTPWGLSLQILGEGPGAARYAGLPVGRLTAFAMSGAGALAGLGGASFVLGFKHYFEEGFTGGAGFLGIAVALLARNRALAVIPSAIFFGALSYGGFVVNRTVPREVLDVLQAVILILFIVFEARRTAGEGRT